MTALIFWQFFHNLSSNFIRLIWSQLIYPDCMSLNQCNKLKLSRKTGLSPCRVYEGHCDIKKIFYITDGVLVYSLYLNLKTRSKFVFREVLVVFQSLPQLYCLNYHHCSSFSIFPASSMHCYIFIIFQVNSHFMIKISIK